MIIVYDGWNINKLHLVFIGVGIVKFLSFRHNHLR